MLISQLFYISIIYVYQFVCSLTKINFNIISIKVVFMYDKKFFKAFHRKGGKSAGTYVKQMMALVRNAFKDKTLKDAIGTTINIKGFMKRYRGTIKTDQT